MSMWNKTLDECGVYGCADDYEDAQKMKAVRQKDCDEAALMWADEQEGLAEHNQFWSSGE